MSKEHLKELISSKMNQYIELKELFEISRDDENVIKMTACTKKQFLFYDLSNLLEKYW